MNKIKLLVFNTPKIYKDVAKIMARCDLGITDIIYTKPDVITFNTYSEITKDYKEKLEERLKGIYEGKELIIDKFEWNMTL